MTLVTSRGKRAAAKQKARFRPTVLLLALGVSAGVVAWGYLVKAAIDFGVTQAGVVVMAVPCLLLFLLLQRHYVRGFMSGALKG